MSDKSKSESPAEKSIRAKAEAAFRANEHVYLEEKQAAERKRLEDRRKQREMEHAFLRGLLSEDAEAVIASDNSTGTDWCGRYTLCGYPCIVRMGNQSFFSSSTDTRTGLSLGYWSFSPYIYTLADLGKYLAERPPGSNSLFC